MAITQHIEFRTEEGHQYFRELEKLTEKQLCEVWDKTMEQIKEEYKYGQNIRDKNR